MSTTWRPHPIVRPVAIGVVRRGDRLLVVAVCDDAGAIKGWRPLGGTIELGERAAEALRREFVEELGEAIAEPRLITVLENLYEHYGARGHEIVFVFDTAFASADAYRRDSFQFQDGGVDNSAQWIELARFRAGTDQLFPVGLIEAL